MASINAHWTSVLDGAKPVPRGPVFVPPPRATAAPRRARGTARLIKYKQFADPAPRDYRVWVEFPDGGREGEIEWKKFEPEYWREKQNKVPSGMQHPRTAAVVATMKVPAAGQRLHGDRELGANATAVSTLLAPMFMQVDEAHEAGFRTVFEYEVAKATGKVPKFAGNAHTKRGNDEEAEIARLFELITGIELLDTRMGNITHHTGYTNATPDGIGARVPMFIEAKSSDKELPWEILPAKHYYQVQQQMLVTADPATGIPRVRFVAVLHYTSHPVISARVPFSKQPQLRSNEPRIRIVLVEFNAEAAARCDDVGRQLVGQMREAGVPTCVGRREAMAQQQQESKVPSSPAHPRQATAPRVTGEPETGRVAPASTPRNPRPWKSARGRGAARGGGRGRARGRAGSSARGRRGGGGRSVAPTRMAGVKFHARVNAISPRK